ncbi:hypothetical protein G6F46_002629 [Rhizopus delemar]|nr:hypothetical protein G6F36_012165 [Rhizopus arrhizus]KAG1463081.1 hypothetical protein G6F55_002598 [Rhizopus delemar]KAG1503175.1 hypothetical protein G6F54_001851 [Rhizopus delemar]KAG1509134.1 hypothetical protein G6F53_007673 [Rhizopus delemar]KAG1525658.1 hypothetical protein G6F52_003125 [Rhizopus delemar]
MDDMNDVDAAVSEVTDLWQHGQTVGDQHPTLLPSDVFYVVPAGPFFNQSSVKSRVGSMDAHESSFIVTKNTPL